MSDATQDELTRLTEAWGLQKLLAEHPESLQTALAASRRLRAGMSRNFTLADEPAHVFRPGEV